MYRVDELALAVWFALTHVSTRMHWDMEYHALITSASHALCASRHTVRLGRM